MKTLDAEVVEPVRELQAAEIVPPAPPAGPYLAELLHATDTVSRRVRLLSFPFTFIDKWTMLLLQAGADNSLLGLHVSSRHSVSP